MYLPCLRVRITVTARPLRKVPGHYLRANHTSWTPPSLISFDTETRSATAGDSEIMTLRLWCARFTDRRAPRRVIPVSDMADGMIADDLSVQIHRWTRQRRTVWAYAHNLGFDLCTSNLVENMLRLRWKVTEFAVGGQSPFVRLRYGDCSLTLSDSWSWFGVPLEQVADAMDMTKPPLPADTDTDGQWLERCRADTNILHDAMLTLMDWWDDEELGKWNITGAASGWNAMRHKPSPQRIVVRPDDDECDHDRKAIYGGRRQIWYTGRYRYGHYTEMDLEKAYTTVCRDMPLPMGRQSTFDSLPTGHRWLNCDRWGIIAECDISTDQAIVPCRIGNAVWYPVGTFRTVLAGPDIRECRDHGFLVRVGSGWLHKLGYPLRPWAIWCLNSLGECGQGIPDVAKLVHRVWARSAIGKWGQRGFEVIPIGPSPNSGWNYEEAWHNGKNVPAGIVDFAGTRYQVAAVNQSDNAYPAILAFVESYVRVAMGRVAAIVGPEHMVQMDTDGCIVDAVGADRAELSNQAIAPLRIRPKRHFRRIKVIGPQHLELDDTKRRSGIPGSAIPGKDGKLVAFTWPKLAWQLANGRPGAYVRPTQEYTLAATYAPGWVLTDGSVVPVELRIGRGDSNEIVPFPETRYARQGLTLGEHQNRHLERYRGGRDQTGH